MIVGRLIPAGTGLAYHSERRRKASGLTDSEMETLSAPAVVPVAAVATVAEPAAAMVVEAPVAAPSNPVPEMLEGDSVE